MPEAEIRDGIGQELLADEVAGVVVSVKVALAVAHLFHQRGRRVAQMQGYGQVAAVADLLQCRIDRLIGGVGFRGRGEVDGALGQWNPALGHPDFGDGVEGGVGQQ